jgi:predicted dehydrogenase
MAGLAEPIEPAERRLRVGLAEPIEPAERRLRVGVAGCGLIAQLVHLPLLDAMGDRFELIGLADASRAVRERLAARYRVPAVADHRALLDSGLDALVVCAPNAAHARMVLDALDAGAHVLVEKPLCLSLADAAEIARRADETGLVVQVGYMKRHSAAYKALARELAGAAPALRLVAAVTVDPGLARDFTPLGFVTPRDVPAAARAQLQAEATAQAAAALGSDDPEHVQAFSEAFLGALVHDVNAVHGLAGEAGRVLDAFAAPGAAVAGGTVELPGGGRWSMAWMRNEGAGPFREELRFFAAGGTWELSFPAPYLRQAPVTCSVERRDGRGGWARRTQASYGDAYARQLEHFLDCVLHRTQCATPAAQAAIDVELLTRLCCAAFGLGVPA